MNHEAGLVERSRRLNSEGDRDHAQIVQFLSRAENYPNTPDGVEIVETHGALVFLAGDRVYKMKRPIRLDFLDCRTLAQRYRSCRRELAINQELAPGVYLGLAAVVRNPEGELTFATNGTPVEWLIVMTRLDADQAFDRMILDRRAGRADVRRIITRLAEFYRAQPCVAITGRDWIDLWREKLAVVRASLTDPLFSLETALTNPPLDALEAFLAQQADLLILQAKQGLVVDAHGDLKPEHIYLGSQVLVIDRLEFDERLRWCDPFDEIIFLGMECRRLGVDWIAPLLVDCLAERLERRPAPALLRFYRVYRACMRARLMIEHLRDPNLRTPAQWARKAGQYLDLAAQGLPLSGQS